VAIVPVVETSILIGVFELSWLLSSGLSGVQDDVKRIAAKQLIETNRFFIKKCFKN
jgi:hypothetical protein